MQRDVLQRMVICFLQKQQNLCLLPAGRLSRLRNVIKENGFEIYNDEQRGDFTFIEGRELQCIQAVRLMIRTE
jgi:hypothetical protein